MRTFERKPKVSQQTAPAKTTLPTWKHDSQSDQLMKIGNHAPQLLRNTNPDSLNQSLATQKNQHFGFDFSQVPMHWGGTSLMPLDAAAQTNMRVNVGAATGQHQDDPVGSSNTNPSAATQPVGGSPVDDSQGLTSAPKVAEVKLITGKEGAFKGFPIVNGVDLNVPGPFNDTKTTGTCVNVHQMQFRLSNGDPNEVKLIRKIVRVGVAGGKENKKGEKDKPADDGPSEGSVLRPEGSSSVVVADDPGFIGKGDASKSKGVFPVSYDADFELYATDIVQPRVLAKMEYKVTIAKQSFDDTAPTNEIKVKSKKVY